MLEANNFSPHIYMEPNTTYIIYERLDIGEPAVHIREKDSGARVYIREDEEYAFIEEELDEVLA